MQLTIYKILHDNVERNVLSFLSHDEVFKTGLTNNSIIGFVVDPQLPITPENVHINPNFIVLFHKVIKAISPTIDTFKLAAEKQKHGHIYIIDRRDRHYPNTKSIDIIGAFELEDGKTTVDDYKANPNYQIISNDGIFQLPEIYCRAIFSEMQL